MLIVLNIRYSLVQVTIRANPRCIEAVLDLAKKLFNYGNSILVNYYAFHFYRFHLIIPLVLSDVINTKSLRRISI